MRPAHKSLVESLQESVVDSDGPLPGVALLVSHRLVRHHLDLLEQRLQRVQTLNEGEHLQRHLVQFLEEDGLLDKISSSSISKKGF